MRWQPNGPYEVLGQGQWANLRADIYSSDLNQVALAADEWTGFMDPAREDLADYPLNGYYSNGIWIEIGQNVDIDGKDIYSVLFFTEGVSAYEQLKVAADHLVDHLQMAGAKPDRVQWQMLEPRGK